jgi:hypothetical protein
MAPTWLTALAWFYIGVCLICAAVILYDIVVDRRRQPMGVMNWVFPITALYFGPFALIFYWRWARAEPQPSADPSTVSVATRSAAVPVTHMAMATAAPGPPDTVADPSGHGRVYGPAGNRVEAPAEPARPRWVEMAIETSHCGSGCTLGDFISEWIIFAFGITIAGYAIFAEYIGDYLLAVSFGIVFQYFAIAPMLGLGVKDGLRAAAKADIISLTCFEIGLFAWMALMTFVFFPAPNNLMPDSIAFWFLMQIGMIIGYFTSWPANVWLVNRGIKVPM